MSDFYWIGMQGQDQVKNSRINQTRKSLKKYQPHNQTIYTFERIIKNAIIFYGCKLSGIFVDDTNTKKNS